MAEKRRKFDAEFREGPVPIVAEPGRPAAEAAREVADELVALPAPTALVPELERLAALGVGAGSS